MCLSPVSFNYIAVGSSDSHVRIYDRRYLSLIDFRGSGTPSDRHTVPVKTFTIPSLEKRPFRVTSINYSSDECELLVSYSSDHLYLMDVTKNGLDCSQVIANSYSQRPKPSSESMGNSPPPVRRLRLRGDWTDTGPDARPEREMAQRVTVGQARPQLQATIMHRMTEVLSRMLADPRTRIGLSAHGNENEISHDNDLTRAVEQFENIAEDPTNYDPPTETVDESMAGPSNDERIAGPSNVSPHARKIRGNSTIITNRNDSVDLDTQRIDDLPEIEIDPVTRFDYMKMKFVGHRNAR